MRQFSDDRAAPAIKRAVAIVGGGISGLTTALALRRAGISVTVYERAATLDAAEAGNGLVVWHNAVRALRAVGLAEPLHKLGQELDRYVFASARGGVLADWSIAAGAERTGAPAYTITRTALHRMLCESLGDDLVLDARCVGFVEDDGGVDVEFDGGVVHRVDLLVGADGLRSSVRRSLIPFEAPPRYAGMSAWQGIVHAPDLEVPVGTFVNTFGRGRFFIYYDLPDGLIYWDAVLADHTARRLGVIGRMPRRVLAEGFAGWPDPVPTLIESSAPDSLQSVDIFDRRPVSRWSSQRVTLVGDAAHPMTFNLGQGANQAIEGAVVLADCVASAPDVATALAAYEARRIDRARRVVRRSRANGAFSRWGNPLVCIARDAFMRVAFPRLVYAKTYQLTMDMGDWTTWSER